MLSLRCIRDIPGDGGGRHPDLLDHVELKLAATATEDFDVSVGLSQAALAENGGAVKLRRSRALLPLRNLL